MRTLTLGVLAVFLLAISPAGAQAQDAQMMAPIKKFIDSFNKGDMPGAASTHAATAELVIIDEVAPFVWRGAKAFDAWSTDLDADAKKRGITEPSVTISAPTRTESSGDQAYVIVPAVYAFKEKGVAMRESAQMTFVLKRGAAGWQIHAWTWTGPKPQKTAK
jgi:hypothetical protein